jgi:adenylate cyclase
MPDVFISYARATAAEAERIAEALRTLGYDVWRDDQLPAHRAYAEVIEERLRAAKAVVVVWSAEAVKSQWVRAEADVARNSGTLVQLRVDAVTPPLPFNQIQCADLSHWRGEADSPAWRKVVASLAELVGQDPIRATAEGSSRRARSTRRRMVIAAAALAVVAAASAILLTSRPHQGPTVSGPPLRSVAILPIQNLTGDPALDAMAGALTEDATTVLARSPRVEVAHNVTLRAAAQGIDDAGLARTLGVRYLARASLKRGSPGFRLTYQVIDAARGQVLVSKDVETTTIDPNIAERQLSLILFEGVSHTIIGDVIRSELAQPPDDKDPENIVARMDSLMKQNRPADIPKVEHLFGLAVATTPRDSRLRVETYLSTCEYYSDLLDAGLERSAAERDSWAQTALDDAAQAAELRPDTTSPHDCRSDVLARLERWDEALAEANHIIEIFPLTANGYGALGNVQFGRGRFEDALKAWTELTVRTGGPPYLIGLTDLFLGRYPAAIAALRESAVSQPKDASSEFFLAAALELSGQHPAAVAAAGSYRRLKTDDGDWRSLEQSHEPAFLAAAAVVRKGLHGAGLDEPADR